MDETLDRLLWPGSKPENPSVIDSSFNSRFVFFLFGRTPQFYRKTFSCPRIKTDLKTGTSIGDLSPEDIGIIAAMGDGLSVRWKRNKRESILDGKRTVATYEHRVSRSLFRQRGRRHHRRTGHYSQ